MSVTVYVRLPEEETPTLCRTEAEPMGNGLFRLLPSYNYDPDDEVWEFLPGSIVKCKEVDDGDERFLLAVEEA